MPVTAKLSKAFYDRFGEEIVTELVEWFNLVDSTYRADLRELNELNFARFDAKLEQRVAQLHARIDSVKSELEHKIDRVKSELEHKIDSVKTELDAKIDKLSTTLEARIDALEIKLNARIATGFAELRSEMDRAFNKQMRFLYLSLATQVAIIIAALAIR